MGQEVQVELNQMTVMQFALLRGLGVSRVLQAKGDYSGLGMGAGVTADSLSAGSRGGSTGARR